jgi:hypothetical protein
MAIVSKNEQNSESGDAPGEPGRPPEPAAPQERRHNLPLKAAPVVGRRPEMTRVVQIFEKVRREGRPRRVEIVGPAGVGASTVAIELARRAGRNFPGGAWYVHLGMGADLGWATVGALRGDGRVRDVAKTAQAARERLAEDPKALVVLDGVESAEQAMAAMPPAGEHSADVFVVAERPLETVDADQVCEVSPVPHHAARRIAHAMLRHSQPDAKPPAVRTTDGLALTASLAARAALAWQGKEGPLSFDDPRGALQRVVQLVARHPTALEMLLLASVAHPVSLPVDALFAALAHVREGRGSPPTQEEAGQGVMWLAHAGVVEPLDERHFSMHPILQRTVHSMTQSPADLEIARAALVAGLTEEADASLGDGGVELTQAALHQLRFLAATASGDARTKAAETAAKIESALAGA